MPTVSLIVVNFRSAALTAAAIRSARAATSCPVQVVVVDNSVDAAEAEALRPQADVMIAAERNLGYAAAINRARPRCDGEFLIVSNPDVVFGSQSIDRLVEVDANVAGPALYWDDDHQWILPPSELHTANEVLGRALASRCEAWARPRDRKRIKRRIAFWSLTAPARVRALSGAVLAMRTSIFDRHGGFDERFHLYFEENDFLRRVGDGIAYVPNARCRHIYNQSAAGSREAATAYAQSERAYLQKWNGGILASILKSLERPRVAPDPPLIGDEPIAAQPGSWIEASPLPAFETAAGHRPSSSSVRLPDAIWSAYRERTLYLRVVEPATGAILAVYARSRIGV